jgi:heme exporter protein D
VDLTRGGVWPSSEADFARGGRFAALPWLAVGATMVWIVLGACVRLEVSFHFAFLQVLSEIPLVI